MKSLAPPAPQAQGAAADPRARPVERAVAAPERVPPQEDPTSATPDSAEAWRARGRFPALDGIRGLSILAVLWHHTAAGLGGIPASSNGFLGVDMFFVLSGFLIVTLCLRERDRTGDISLRRFYARRTLRIFPIYYLVLAALWVLVTVHPAAGMRDEYLRGFPFHLTYTTNWIQSATFLAIAWSLATEEQFYLLWPPVEKFLRRAALPVLAAFLALNQLVNFGLLDGWLERAAGLARADYAILQVTFTPICLGVLLAHALHAPAGFRALSAVFARWWMPWSVLALLILTCSVPGDLSGLPRLAIQVSMALLIAACVLRERHPVARLVSLAPLRWIGAVSYGMYLYHHFARHAAANLLQELDARSPGWLFLATAALTILVAAASFRWIEAPLSRWGRRAA